jgi:hypothetical protein
MASEHVDSISSCNSAAFADRLLHQYNPQDGEDDDPPPKRSRLHQANLSYSSVTNHLMVPREEESA